MRNFILKLLSVLLLCAGFFGTCSAHSSNVVIVFSSDEDGELKAEFSPESGLDFGILGATEKRRARINLDNRTKENIYFEGLRSPCPCIEFENEVEQLDADGKGAIVVALDATGYEGKFSKFVHFACRTDGNSSLSFFLPTSFEIRGDAEKIGTGKSALDANILPSEMKTADFEEKIVWLDYDALKKKGKKAISDAAVRGAWLFGARDCPTCNHLKKNVLPRLSDGLASFVVVSVNLDVRENFLLLLRLEEKLGSHGKKTPVMYWDGRLFYGAEAIKEFVANFAENSDENKRINETVSSDVLSSLLVGDDSGNEALGGEDLLKKKAGEISLGVIVLAGLADGVNPCVFSTLIFFASLLAASRSGGRKMVLAGAVFCLSSFLAYFAIGLGGLNFLRLFSGSGLLRSMLEYLTCAILLILAFLSFRDAFRYRRTGDSATVSLQLPDGIKKRIRELMKRGISYRFLLPGIFLTGLLVTGLETVCTGQVYVPTLVYISGFSGSDGIRALWYLVLYNFAFIVPLLGVLGVVCAGGKAVELAGLGRKGVFWGKLAMGVIFIILAVSMLYW